MKLISFFARLFGKSKKRKSMFADSLQEGLNDTFREMGYNIVHRQKD